MLKPTDRAYISAIPLSLMVILSALLVGTPSCEPSTYVLGRLEEESLGGTNGGDLDECHEVGESCAESVDCCSAECVREVCAIPVPSCRGTGSACTQSPDCCSLSCVDNVCGDSCVADGLTCDAGGDCCSGICEGEVCLTLNEACFTAGNPCLDNGECCSGLCDSEICSLASSFCTQEGDICTSSADCCSQTCELVEGESVGTCAAAPSGPSFCMAGIAGSLCEDCNDCCSRLCVPFGEHGLSVCALAKGCRQTGELCGDDLDCCGGDASSSLPGAGNVTCEKGSEEQWGICRNAISCSPQGNVCHIQNYACGVSAAANKCCGIDGTEGVCRLDEEGVPRCNGLGSSCQVEGDSCATNEDCCAGLCLPTEAAGLTCQTSGVCIEADDPCTATSECCPGLWCERQAEGAFGHCSEDDAVACSLEGQICDGAGFACCSGLSCESGHCRGGLE